MSLLYFILAVTPALAFTFYNKIRFYNLVSYRELSLSIGVNVSVAYITLTVYFIYSSLTLSDIQIMNGVVSSKQQVETFCEHDYRCNPRRVCTGTTEQTCRTEYDTCYEHSNDYDWVIRTTVGDVEIPRVDRRGLKEPPRFTEAKISEHASIAKPYINYLLADPDSLFLYGEAAIGKYEGMVPEYPTVYDYYRFNHVVNMTSVPDAEFMKFIQDRLSASGEIRQLNIISVFTNHEPDFFYALMHRWKGGKKNDVIMVFGIDDQKKIKWFSSTSLGMGMNNQLMHNHLKSHATGAHLDMATMTLLLDVIEQRFERVPMEEFKHLRDNMEIPAWLFIVVLLINIVVSYAVGYVVREN